MHQPRVRIFFLMVAAALGLMAFMAVAAQAGNLGDGGKAGKFLVNKAAPTVGTTFALTQVGTNTILVPTRVDILCTGSTVTGQFKSSTEVLGGAKFTGCTAWAPVSTFPYVTKLSCTVSTKKEGTGGEKETIVIEKAIALSKLHEKAPYVLLEGDGGTPFTTIFFEGPECGLPKENILTGSVVGAIDNNDAVEPTVLLSQAIQKLFQTEKKKLAKKLSKATS